jgi:3'(2'), 5'-bisphosphate nucleotidase
MGGKYQAEFDFAVQVVGQASQLARQIQQELTRTSLTKEDFSPVTVADFSVQALLSYRLAQSFPADPLVAEESAQALRKPTGAQMLAQVTGYVSRHVSEANPAAVCNWIERGQMVSARRFWVCDPVDGTKGFLRGGQYTVALALLEDGQVQLGVLGCPAMVDPAAQGQDHSGVLVAAHRSQGAWSSPLAEPTQFHAIHVSSCQDIHKARLVRSYAAEHTNVALVDLLASDLGIKTPPVRVDSQVKYALLASGAVDLFFRLLPPFFPGYLGNIWDIAAGAVIVEEAGGRVTDLDGQALDFTTGRTLQHNRGALASNGWLHEIALQALRRRSV